MTIAVDFDGTIVDHAFPNIGAEKPFAIEYLKLLASQGHKIILWTVREGKLLDDAILWCHERGLDFYAVNSEYPGAGWSGSGVSRKINADVYIDDSNIGTMPDWAAIYEMISSGKPHRHIHSDSKSHSHHHHHHRHSIFSPLINRCKQARKNFR